MNLARQGASGGLGQASQCSHGRFPVQARVCALPYQCSPPRSTDHQHSPCQAASMLGRTRHISLTSVPLQGRQEAASSHVVRALAGAGAESSEEGDSTAKLAALGCLFVAWYGTNIWFNIYNKQLFSIFPFPLTTTNIQFAIGSVVSLVFWATGFVKLPQFNMGMIKSIYPLAMIHVLGNVLTNVSLGHVSVSFTHTVKAAEPFFSVLFSALFLGDVPPLPVLLTLIPIVGGVVIASLSEATFNWIGFSSAIFSNVTFQSRNVLSKKLMITKGSVDNVNLFQIITIMSFFMLLPISLAIEHAPILPAKLTAMGLSSAVQEQMFQRLLVAGLCFHSYQQLSYMILSRVAPITHSIGNCVKRVVVIVASLIIFQNPISSQNAAGTGLALFGVFLYSQAKRLTKGQKGAARASSD
mmetsp:Transcript_16455/g.28200  ORF Transcript_16455/g.28200 Transcript_16455/m.28200 type:complete len:412 (-) Transcript_16455:692-1927(-)|eukprot:CAMPEP_0119108340 /NCGR_PEP_ID=MMETSP1180-20130426/13835_1 /TAXON_ID=3052 ORGANISM="Chlamydomonas cf sp, Strain CCMP681" /NCGR_SAMPLE_ID=MMETSP1180 /ASSEMBLY_ACC=CAM_ASM_000741 /LENGTH=411 /DNA_ID=CAMNT_0007093945 /DNA_START=20 /DNA_END=1255 /DNA_ORIENTATION=+